MASLSLGLGTADRNHQVTCTALVDSITTTFGLRFSVHTEVSDGVTGLLVREMNSNERAARAQNEIGDVILDLVGRVPRYTHLQPGLGATMADGARFVPVGTLGLSEVRQHGFSITPVVGPSARQRSG